MPDISVQDLIRKEAARQGVPVELALAVAEQESGFNPTAVNPASGAMGTFQFLPSTAKARSIDAMDPAANITGGVGYLRELLDQHQGDLTKVLSTYGGVKTDTTYVPGVLARMAKYQAAPPKPTSLQQSVPPASAATPPPQPTFMTKAAGFGMDVLHGLDPRNEQGRRNLAGGAAAAAATALAPELAVPAWVAKGLSVAVPLAGAYLGGASENVAERGVRAAVGAPPTPTSIQAAGREQMANEALGQVVAWPLKTAGRRIMATSVAKSISTGLSDALEAVKGRLNMGRTAASPAQAGRMVEAVTHGEGGAAKTVKDQLGEAVTESAKSGPAIPTAPLKERLQELATQITPMASHEQTVSIPGYTAEQTAAIAKRNPDLGLSVIPDDHPLPATLDRVRAALTDQDTISFEDAHKIKRLLDDAVNWDSPAKKQVQQITKGFRQTLREQMAVHKPYNEATEAYGTVAKLYGRSVNKLHQEILSNPEGLVDRLHWDSPSSVQMLKDLTTEVPKQGSETGASQGAAAWDAVRAAWTQENLIAKGPARMAKEIEKIEASNSGREFVSTMYGDPAGQTVWTNLKQIASRLQEVNTATKAFSQSDLANTTPLSGTVRDFALAMAHGHPIGKVGATARLVFGKGTSAADMLQWASYSSPRTQFLIKHVLTGPEPALAFADFVRWWKTSGENPDKLAVRHDQGPPKVGTVRTSTGTEGPPRPASLP